MRHGRFITTALVATAAMAIGPAWASAAPSPLVDDAQRTSRRPVRRPVHGRSSLAGALEARHDAENFDSSTLRSGRDQWVGHAQGAPRTRAPPRCLGAC